MTNIKIYWETNIKDLLKDYHSYILDVVFVSNTTIKIIELNPFVFLLI
jgi:hypothetical protein